MGARVVLAARNRERLEQTRSLMVHPDQHLVVAADLTEPGETEKIPATIAESLGKIDGIVHCAGISQTLPLRSVSYEKMLSLFNINVFAAYQLTRIASNPKYFAADGGSIIFISSVAGIAGENAKSAYSMSKGALIAGARSLAVELAPKKIRINCISPGLIITPFNENSLHITDPAIRKTLESQHPLGLGKPDDVALASVYLLSDSSRWITGINLVVDGGYCIG